MKYIIFRHWYSEHTYDPTHDMVDIDVHVIPKS